MDRLLREESEMSRGRVRQQAIITSANYVMKLKGQEAIDGVPCEVIELSPKRKSPYLLKGRMWVNSANMLTVKIEGSPPVSATFFEGRPRIVRKYRVINGVAFAERIRATSGSFFFGKSTVDIEYRDYRAISQNL